ncbi:MAG: helix-turn-helix domain-containing protein [Nitrospirales bacterium]
MEVCTLITLLEEAMAQGKVVDIPGLLGELERLKAMLWSRMVTVSYGPTSHQLHDSATLLTLPQVAMRLAIPEGRAYELARQGTLPTVRVGKYVRVSMVELETWVGQQTTLERRIDRAPPDFHSARGEKKKCPARALTGTRPQPGGVGRANHGRSPSQSPPNTPVHDRPQPTTRCSMVEPHSTEAEKLPEEE